MRHFHTRTCSYQSGDSVERQRQPTSCCISESPAEPSHRCLSLHISASPQLQTGHKISVQKTVFKKARPSGFFGFYWVLGFTVFFDFYCNEELGSLLVDLAHLFRFASYFRLSKNLQIHYLLVVRSCKHEEIFNYYCHEKQKLNYVWCRFLLFFSTGFTQKMGITRMYEPYKIYIDD